MSQNNTLSVPSVDDCEGRGSGSPTDAPRSTAAVESPIKQYRLRLRPKQGAISTFDGAVVKRDGIEPRAFLSLDRRRDGTVVAIYEMAGDPAVLEAILTDATAVHQWAIFNDGGGTTFNCYLRFEPEPLGERLFAVLDEYGLVLDTPLPFTPDGGLLVTVAGPESAISAAVAAVPDDVTLELTQLQDYEPGERSLKGVLTARQREVLAVALEQGYYSLPREATQTDLAAEFDCTPTTIGNHLRKAEARLFSEVFGGSP